MKRYVHPQKRGWNQFIRNLTRRWESIWDEDKQTNQRNPQTCTFRLLKKQIKKNKKNWKKLLTYAKRSDNISESLVRAQQNKKHMERCPSGLRSWSWKPVILKGTVGSNPTFSVFFNLNQEGIGLYIFLSGVFVDSMEKDGRGRRGSPGKWVGR